MVYKLLSILWGYISILYLASPCDSVLCRACMTLRMQGIKMLHVIAVYILILLKVCNEFIIASLIYYTHGPVAVKVSSCYTYSLSYTANCG